MTAKPATPAKPPKHTPTFADDFRKFFLRGLAILLPSIVTIALLFWAYGFLHNNIASPINAGVREATIALGPRVVGRDHMDGYAWFNITEEEIDAEIETRRNKSVPREVVAAELRRESLAEVWRERWYLTAIGFVVAIILVYLAGVLVGNYLGRRIYHRVEGWFVRLPVIKQVYPNVKQVTDFLFGGSDEETGGPPKAKLPSSGRVVLVEYPRKGIWTIGLLTGATLRAVEDVVGERCVTVFIPSSPTPFTGYTITVPEREVYEMPISFDETIRFVVSGGVLVPPRQVVDHPMTLAKAPVRPEDTLPEHESGDAPSDGGEQRDASAHTPPTWQLARATRRCPPAPRAPADGRTTPA